MWSPTKAHTHIHWLEIALFLHNKFTAPSTAEEMGTQL